MISFVNPGLIDPRAISILGVSVKENENPIGYFGTGLKYAIAIILRHRGEITIWRGTEPYRFAAKCVQVRGQPVNVVTMNDEELGFTTDLGKNWLVWQAFRELYCNVKDEGGVAEPGERAPSADATTVHVSLPEFEKCLDELPRYFAPEGEPPAYRGEQVAFRNGPSDSIYYRSILVYKSSDKPFLFPPDFTAKIDLTEDRTMKWPYQIGQLISRDLFACQDVEFLERWLSAPEKYAEYWIDIDWSGTPSQTFLDACERLFRDTSRRLNPAARKVMLKHRPAPERIVCKVLPGEQAIIDKACAFCEALGYSVNDFPIIIVESLGGSGLLGLADRRTRQVVLARHALTMGDLTLAATILEEWAHIKHGFDDCSHDMQNWLFEALMRIGREYLVASNHELARLAA